MPERRQADRARADEGAHRSVRERVARVPVARSSSRTCSPASGREGRCRSAEASRALRWRSMPCHRQRARAPFPPGARHRHGSAGDDHGQARSRARRAAVFDGDVLEHKGDVTCARRPARPPKRSPSATQAALPLHGVRVDEDGAVQRRHADRQPIDEDLCACLVARGSSRVQVPVCAFSRSACARARRSAGAFRK